MRFVRHTEPAKVISLRAGSVVAIGAFDGLHLGHQALLRQTLRIANKEDLVSVILSFEPTPKEYFAKDSAPARLMRFREKYVMLESLGIDLFCCPRFDQALAAQSPSEFAASLLAGSLNAKQIVVGDDFQYAAKRAGNLQTLQRDGEANGFGVHRVTAVEVDGQRVSSTAIRDALARADLGAAANMLGRPVAMGGRVSRGARLGRTLGYPTANIAVARRVSPLHGIYAVRVSFGAHKHWPAVASIGTRPSVDDGQVLLEVHLFGFDGNLYGQNMQVEFVKFLRQEEKFDSLELLMAQMDVDAEEAKRVLSVEKETKIVE